MNMKGPPIGIVASSLSGNQLLQMTTDYFTAVSIPNDGTVYYPGTAQEITGEDMWTGINNTLHTFLNNGIGPKFRALWGFIGAASAKTKFNVFNPADTDAAFRGVFVGSPTHNRTGVAFNGSTQYMNTKFRDSDFGAANGCMGFYRRTTNVGSYVDMGCRGANGVTDLELNYGNIATYGGVLGNTRLNWGAPPVRNDRNILINRLSGTSLQLIRDGVSSTIVSNTQTPNNLELWLGGLNDSGALNVPSNNEYGCAYIFDSLTSAQAMIVNNAIDALMVALKRNV